MKVEETMQETVEVAVTAPNPIVRSLADSRVLPYNGLKNVSIVKNADLEIRSIPSSLSGARTYIVENGDLYINGNLDYKSNIAFVVKGGNIYIDEDVTRMDGTYITIPKAGK